MVKALYVLFTKANTVYVGHLEELQGIQALRGGDFLPADDSDPIVQDVKARMDSSSHPIAVIRVF